MTKGESRARVVRELREEATPVYWTGDEIDAYYDAGLDSLLETGAIVERTVIGVTPGQRFVDLPGHAIQALAAREIGTPTSPRPIRFEHWKTIDQFDAYFERTESFAPDLGASFGLGTLVFWPGFAEAGVLEIMFSAVYANPLAAGDTPNIPVEYHEGLVDYQLARCLVKDCVSGDQLGRAQRHMKAFNEIKGGLRHYAEKRHISINRSIYGPPRYP